MSGARSVCCWGAQLMGDDADATPCAPGFVVGKRHFKTKFCTVHRQEMWLPAERMRSLPDSLADKVANNRSGGVWNVMHLPLGAGDVRYRVINNTEGCYLTRLIVFEEAPPPHLPWAPLPTGLVTDEEGCVQLSVAKGTVVPTLVEGVRRERQRPMPRSTDTSSSSPPSPPSPPSPASSPSPPPSPVLEPGALEVMLNQAMAPEPESPTPSPLEPPTLSTVLVPSVLMKLSGAPPACEAVPALSTDPDSPPPEDMTTEEKAERRMRRNRMSAAVSRERKRKYIEELEDAVTNLEGQVVALYEENRLWQSLELPPLDDGSFFNAVCNTNL